MAFFSNLDSNYDITDITLNNSTSLGSMDKASQEIMHGKSSFSITEKEIMATFISGLNSCSFCHGSHKAASEQFRVLSFVSEQLLKNIKSAPIKEKLKPIFHYLKKTTNSPSKLVESNMQKVIKAGWSIESLHKPVLVGCLFNFCNLLLDEHGVDGNITIYLFPGKHLSKNNYGVP